MYLTDADLYYLWTRFGGRCSYGGRAVRWSEYGVKSPTGWEVDHGVPLSRGGVDDGRNLRVACWACNRFKADMTAQEWMYRINLYYGGTCPRWYLGQPIRYHP